MISLAYYLRVVAAMWMRRARRRRHRAASGRPPGAGRRPPEADAPAVEPEAWFVALVFGAATLFFGHRALAAVRPGRATPGRSLTGLF